MHAQRGTTQALEKTSATKLSSYKFWGGFRNFREAGHGQAPASALHALTVGALALEVLSVDKVIALL